MQRVYYGYKNRIGVDRRHKFVRRYGVSDASLHDSQKLEDVLDTGNTASDVWADSAYREPRRSRKSFLSAVSRAVFIAGRIAIAKAEAQKAANTALESARARRACIRRPENGMGAGIARAIGAMRAVQDRDEPRPPHPPLRLY